MTEIILLGSATLFLATFFRLKRYLHIFQLEEYLPDRFANWLRDHYHFERVEALLAITTILAGAYAATLPNDSQEFIVALTAACWLVFYAPVARRVLNTESQSKKPIVFTARAIRLLATSLFLFIIASSMAVVLAFSISFSALRFALSISALWLLSQLSPFFLLAANVVLFPLEEILRQRFLFRARRKIRSMPNLQVIGVTGSYGKTSTKENLASILSSKYRVAKTPQSFNTLMGVCKAINENLSIDHEIFIVEMGAYRSGEIHAICDLVKPRIGVITAIGPQHLERFGSLDAIAAAKYELIESLPANGVAVFNADDEYCARLADKTEQRAVRYGMCDGATLRAKNISSGAHGLMFEIVVNSVIASREAAKQSRRHNQGDCFASFLATAKTAPRNDTVSVHTALLGRHNVSNILAASAVALELGMSLVEIGAAIAKLEPVPHRLQLLPGANGVNVIDDAYNSNPIGAMNALDVLNDFNSGKKILITPGLVELGSESELQNKRLGEKAAAICDYVFIVGNGNLSKAIEAGLVMSKFPKEHYRVFETLNDAVAQLGTILTPGDTVLFENDLPDHY